MRKVIVNNIVSLDGCYADESGNPLALTMDGAFDRANLDTIAEAELVLLGRDSFEGFSLHWPFVADAPAPTDPRAPESRAFDDTNRATSRHYNRLPKVVVSDRGPVPRENAWHDSTTVVSRLEAADWLAAAKQDGDGTIVIFGSHLLWNALLAEGLIDELHLMVSPVALGPGVPLFTTPASLELLAVQRFEGSSNVQLRSAEPLSPHGAGEEHVQRTPHTTVRTTLALSAACAPRRSQCTKAQATGAFPVAWRSWCTR